MKKTRRILTLALALVMLFGITGNVFAAKFPDMNNHWAAKYIDWATNSNIVVGYPDGTFKPQGQITQAEFYKMVNKIADYKEKSTVNYSDVKTSDWFHEEVAKGVKAGYLKNNSTTLNPNTAITRDEASRIMAYVYGLKENTTATNIFTDANSILNRGAVGSLVDKKIINGYPNKTFKPLGTLTRAEFTKILYTAVHNLGLPTLYKSQKPVQTPVTQTKSCPYPTEWAALKKAVDDGNYYLGRQANFNQNQSNITELRNAVNAGQTMLNVYSGRGNNYNYKNIVSREYRSFEDFYGINYSAFNSRVDAKNFWDLNSYYGNNGNYYLRNNYNTVNNTNSTFNNWTDFYNRYKATHSYSQILDMWNSGRYNNTTNCPYTRDQIVKATDRIRTAIKNYTNNIGNYDYTVTFNSMGGTNVSPQRIIKGNTVQEPSNPTRTGFTFAGWYTDYATQYKYHFSSKVYNNFTLYAKWIPGSQVDGYNINIINVPGATIVTSPSGKARVNENVEVFVNVKNENKVVDKIFVDGDAISGNTFRMPAKNVNVTATLKDKNIAVEHNINIIKTDGVDVSTSPTKAAAGKNVTVSYKITDNSKEFDAILLDGVSISGNTFTMKNKDVSVQVTLKDKEVKKYNVTFNVEGQESAVAVVEEGSTVSQPGDPEIEGKTFKEWQLNGTKYDFNKTVTGNITLTAVFETVAP